MFEKRGGHAERVMEDCEWDGHAGGDRVDGDGLAGDGDVRAAEVAEGAEDRDAAGIDEITIVRQDVNGGEDGPDLCAGEDAEGFGVESGGSPDRFFKDTGQEAFEFCLSGGLVVRWREWIWAIGLIRGKWEWGY